MKISRKTNSHLTSKQKERMEHHFAINWQQKCLHLALLNGHSRANFSRTWPQKNEIQMCVSVCILAAMNVVIYKQQWLHCWPFPLLFLLTTATLCAHGQRDTQSHRIFSGCVEFYFGYNSGYFVLTLSVSLAFLLKFRKHSHDLRSFVAFSIFICVHNAHL